MIAAYRRASPHSRRSALLALLLIALAFRLYHLDQVDLRGDEAFDVLYAAQPLSEVIRNDLCCQAYPPLNHTALHYWSAVAGSSEFAYRFLFGVVPGLLAVALVYRLTQELFPEPAPGIAAMLAAANPFLIWWAQDGHFYGGLTALCAAILWLGLRSLRRGCTWRSLVPYVAVSALGLYFHYFAAFAVLGVAMTTAVRAAGEHRVAPWARRMFLAHLAVAALVAPWALLALGMMQHFQLDWAPVVSLPAALGRLAQSYSLGYTAPSWATWTLPAFAVAAVAGLASRRREGDGLTAAVLLVGPLLVFWAASLVRPMFDDKFAVFVLPVYLAVLGGGLAWPRLRRVTRLGLLALLLTASGASLVRYYHDPATYKSPDWSAAADTVRRLGSRGDLLVYDFPDPALLYYTAEGPAEVRLVPGGADTDSDDAAAEMETLARERERVWLVPLARPEWSGGDDVERWLERHCLLEEEYGSRGVALRLYRTPRGLADSWTSLDVRFEGGPRLAGYLLERREGGPATIRVVLLWRATGPTDRSYSVFVHLVGPDGGILGQHDNPPVGGRYPTTEWAVGEEVVDSYSISVPPGTDLAQCRLRVGLYRPDTGRRLVVAGADSCGDYVELGVQ